MATIHGPHGATLKYNDDDVDPKSIEGIQEQWKCLSKQLCNWPWCQCDPVAEIVMMQTYDYDFNVPYTFENHSYIIAAKNREKPKSD